jgi:hypothetical protein
MNETGKQFNEDGERLTLTHDELITVRQLAALELREHMSHGAPDSCDAYFEEYLQELESWKKAVDAWDAQRYWRYGKTTELVRQGQWCVVILKAGRMNGLQ